MIRLGLCCQFLEQPIRFRHTTAKQLQKVARAEQLVRLNEICQHNVDNLQAALAFCERTQIRAFRILTPLLPRYTHPDVGYTLEALPQGEMIRTALQCIGQQAKKVGIRLSFHPDQFVLLNSPRADVVEKSVAELSYQAMLADLVGAESINLHGGGAYGDKPSALKQLRRGIDSLPDNVRSRLTLENDDRTYTPADLLPVCQDVEVPLTYDIHHHRCLPDTLTLEEATDACEQSWQGREAWCHISSPKNGYDAGDDPRPHADIIRLSDWPDFWHNRCMTVDVEAKAKEVAVLKLQQELNPN